MSSTISLANARNDYETGKSADNLESASRAYHRSAEAGYIPAVTALIELYYNECRFDGLLSAQINRASMNTPSMISCLKWIAVYDLMNPCPEQSQFFCKIFGTPHGEVRRSTVEKFIQDNLTADQKNEAHRLAAGIVEEHRRLSFQ